MTRSHVRPELSSIASALEELTGRIATLGEDAQGAGDDQLAHDLFDVERSLNAGVRRLQARLNNSR